MDLTGWDAAAALAKAMAYAGTLGAAGASLFLVYSGELLRDAQRRCIRREIIFLAVLAMVASAARISLLAASMSGEFSDMADVSSAGMILGAGEGSGTALRMLGLALCAAVFKAGRLTGTVACVGAILAASSFAAVGHVHTLKPDELPTALLTVHLTCAAFWVGALHPLLRVSRDADVARTAALAARFGQAALYVVGGLILAGTLIAYRLLGSLAALWMSGYGRLLGVKLLLVAALLTAAAVNKLWLTPSLRAGDAAAAASLGRSIRFEMIVAGMILLVTAAFTSFTGPQA